MEFRIIPMSGELWPAVREIYRQGIETGNATFATETPDWAEWNSTHRRDCRLVAIEGIDKEQAAPLPLNKPTVLGWAALRPVSTRQVYRGVAEVSVYVAAAARGKGVGKSLLNALVEESETNGIWTLQAGIFPENVPSISLHRSCGFRQVGVRRRIGQHHDRWRDVLLLERRSALVGT